jgi:acyl carrier protein
MYGTEVAIPALLGDDGRFAMLEEALTAEKRVATFLNQFQVAVDFQEQVQITPETVLESLPEWDSLAALGVIVMCDTEYDVAITGNDLKECATVGDIFAKVLAKKAA